MEKMAERIKLIYNAELNCMVDVTDSRYVQGIDGSIEYRKVGEEEDEFRKYLDGITTDNICNEYVHGFNDAIQVIKDRFETYELHRKEGK